MRNNLQKLIFYALSSHEKLDRIGEYLAKRLCRDVVRNRIRKVYIAMEAMDQLLAACHSQSVNLFVESFLRMVQKLLECPDPDLQCAATASFVKFSNIEEDAPSYHRQYDFFVSKFSSMCHSNHQTAGSRVRTAGLQGLQGVIRKTVSDELQANIWDQQHMDKIVPSLLYNMHGSPLAPPAAATTQPKDLTGVVAETTLSQTPMAAGGVAGSGVRTNSDSTTVDPAVVAEEVFRDLVCRASFGNLPSVLKPVLMHFDNHQLWSAGSGDTGAAGSSVSTGGIRPAAAHFPTRCFKIIMYAVQAQHGHLVVQELMRHLDHHSKSTASLKTRIAEVLTETVVIAAGGSIGPSVLDVFNSLLRHLRSSVESNTASATSVTENDRFQEVIINTIGEFANHLPDYQKIEILMFIMGKVPLGSGIDSKKESERATRHLQKILLKTVLRVATKYCTQSMANAFPSSLLLPLLQMSLAADPAMRLLVHSILHTLLDRHGNASKLAAVTIPDDMLELGLTVEKPSRQDVLFLKKNGPSLYWHLLQGAVQASNTAEHYLATFRTACLMLLELGSDDVTVEFVHFALQLQIAACESGELSTQQRQMVHATVAAFLYYICELTTLTCIAAHVTEIIELRRHEAPCVLPPMAFQPEEGSQDGRSRDPVQTKHLFSKEAMVAALKASGEDSCSLSAPLVCPDSADKQASAATGSAGANATGVESDGISINLETDDSAEPSPMMARRKEVQQEEITADRLKVVLETDEDKRAVQQRREQQLEMFQSAPLESLKARAESRHQLNEKLLEILSDIEGRQDSADPAGGSGDRTVSPTILTPLADIKYPDLFVY